VLHEASEELHGHVLEREGGAVEELEDEEVVCDLDEGADGRMAKSRVGLLDHPVEVGHGDLPVDERAENRLRDVRVAPPGEALDGLRRQHRPALG
jgi:hypothetical protein